MEVGCLAASIDTQTVALESERAFRATEKLEAVSTAKALKASLATITTKDGELNAARAAAQAQALEDVVATRAEVSTVRAEVDDMVAVALAEVEKAAEDEFAAGFFQDHSDLKRRVIVHHPEWDLSAYSGVDSDYWESEVSAE